MKLLKKLLLLASIALLAACKPDNPTPGPDGPGTDPVETVRNGKSGITYQLLVYSFANSNGDGIGDFKGIE